LDASVGGELKEEEEEGEEPLVVFVDDVIDADVDELISRQCHDFV